MQIFSVNVSPPCCHVHTCKSSSPIPAHTKMHYSIDTKHTSPKRSLSSHQHAVPVKSNAMYALLVPVCGKVSQRRSHLLLVLPPPTVLAGLFYVFVPQRHDASTLNEVALLGDQRLHTSQSHIYNLLSFMQLLPYTVRRCLVWVTSSFLHYYYDPPIPPPFICHCLPPSLFILRST